MSGMEGVQFGCIISHLNMDRTAHSQVFQDYQPNDSLFDSHFTRLTQSQANEDNWFIEQRAYSRSVLAGWGLPLGQLPYTPDNQQTLRSLVELIAFRQKDLQFRSKVKDDIAAINFEKDKYRSFMEQAQRSLEQCTRKLGRTENQSSDLKNKSRRTEAQAKKERDQDRKMITMLKTKNEQILHEIKKKQQEVNRVKQQMKKSVGEKSLQGAKNSFEVFQCLSPTKKEASKQDEAKYIFLLERNQRQMNDLVRQNALLRQKLFQIRQIMLDFNEWVDRELFGEGEADPYKRTSRFPINHNLLFKRESLVNEFSELLQTARDGIAQLKDIYRGMTPPMEKKARSSELLPRNSQDFDLKFKKKVSKPDFMKTDRSRPELKEPKGRNAPLHEKIDSPMTENHSPRSRKAIPVPKFDSSCQPPASQTALNKGFDMKPPQPKKRTSTHNPPPSLEQIELPFEDELLSDVIENQDSSIVSHIEVSKLGKNKFDKWDILYQDDE